MTKHIIIFSLVLLCILYFSCRHTHDDKHVHNHNHEHKHEHGVEHDHDHEHIHNKGEGHGHDDPKSHEHGHEGANKHMHKSSFEDLVKRFESKERDEYQQPGKVLDHLCEINEKKIMEIGAGTGYFSFRLVEAGAKVIAADVDEKFQAFMKNKKDSLNIKDDKLELRKVPYDSSTLDNGEVDMVLVVNTYHHIEKRPYYFAEVFDGLKEDGKLVIIDFFKKDVPVGPPVEMKLSEDEVQAELKRAGFKRFEINSDLLDYQYIISAYKS
ncbi:MAG: class I SAM-dependent methyltransferase [Bacteroidia bacterium]|nr:class I SAM-dependent methyltransferase [Bacteroidia bacterium]